MNIALLSIAEEMCSKAFECEHISNAPINIRVECINYVMSELRCISNVKQFHYNKVSHKLYKTKEECYSALCYYLARNYIRSIYRSNHE